MQLQFSKDNLSPPVLSESVSEKNRNCIFVSAVMFYITLVMLFLLMLYANSIFPSESAATEARVSTL